MIQGAISDSFFNCITALSIIHSLLIFFRADNIIIFFKVFTSCVDCKNKISTVLLNSS